MSFFDSLIIIISAYGLQFLLGFGLTFYCLPEKQRNSAILIAPSIGYISFCFFSIWFSELASIPIIKSNFLTLSLLIALTLLIVISMRSYIVSKLEHAASMSIFFGIMLVVTFLPALVQGVDLYIGTANPDFYQSLSFHEVLSRLHTKFWVLEKDLSVRGPFMEMYPSPFQARFGGVAFSVLLEQVFGCPSRTALMVSVISFLLTLPGAVYFFCLSVIEFDKKASILAGMLISISSPITMSFMHSFVGQNSALAALPLSIGLLYLTIKQVDLKLIILCCIILCGDLWLYVVILPYIIVPIAIFGMLRSYKMSPREVVTVIRVLSIISLISLSVHLSVVQSSLKYFNDFSNLIARLNPAARHAGDLTQYYTEYLTEDIFIYALGLASYPLSHSLYFNSFSEVVSPILISIGISIGILCFYSVLVWSRSASRDAVILVISMIGVYIAVWINYTFLNRYGYAPFKMSVWLQFLLIPFIAWSIIASWDVCLSINSGIKKYASFGTFVITAPCFVGFNIAADVDYGLKSFGRDRLRGTIINSYGIGGNADFLDLKRELAKNFPDSARLAVGFSDSIQNYWAAYYADSVASSISMLSHQLIPYEDALLPDIKSRKYVDALGVIQIDEQKYFNDGQADYYLLPGEKNLNSDIVLTPVKGQKLWGNGTFSLYKNGALNDLIVLGRGFYRVEHIDAESLSWWWPDTFRWSAEGGEIYQLMPTSPGKPYRVQLSVIAGLGLISGHRTVEIWHNNSKFDEVFVDGISRIISKPYYPTEGVNRIVLRVKEKPVLVSRNFGLWNRDLPNRSTPINVLFSDIRLLNGMEYKSEACPTNIKIEPKQLLKIVETFNGIDINGWVRERGWFTALLSQNTSKAEVEILIPGNLNFTFPYKVRFIVNDVIYDKEFLEPGYHIAELDIPDNSKGLLRMEVLPQSARQLLDGINQREVIQSIRFNYVKLLSRLN